MKFSLSGRLVELGGGKLALPNVPFIELAKKAGYDGVDLRASQLSPDSPPEALPEVKKAANAARLKVAILGLKSAGEQGLAALPKTLEMAKELGCKLLRVGGDVAFLQKAADMAAARGIRLGTQMHTGGEFETVALAVETLAKVGRKNFGLITEPANSHMAGEAFTADNFRQIATSIFASNIQSLVVVPPDQTPTKLKLRNGKEIGYKRTPLAENKDMMPAEYFAVLRAVGFNGWVNMLEPHPGEQDLLAFAKDYLGTLKKLALG